MILAIFKTTFTNSKRRELNTEITNHLIKVNLLLVLHRHAPVKSGILRVIYAPYVPKIFQEAITKRFLLERKYFKFFGLIILLRYTKKTKIIMSDFIKRRKKEFLSNLILSFVTVNKNFWKVVKQLFS